MNTTALLEEENVNLDLNYLEGLMEQEKYPDETNAELVNLEDYLVEQEPEKIPLTAEEAIWLDNALFLQTYKSNSPEIKQLTDQIFKEIKINEENIRNKRINEACKTMKTLEMVLINLWIGYFYGQPIMFYLDKNKYNMPRRYQKGYFSYDRIQIVIRNMQELGYIEIRKGYFYDKKDNRNRISRMWATPKLFGNFLSSTDSQIPDFYEPDDPEDIIILRDKNNKKDIDYKDNKQTRKMREQLKSHNEFINQFTITMEMDGKVEISNSFLVETLHKNIINRKISIKNICIDKNIDNLPIMISDELVQESGTNYMSQLKNTDKMDNSFLMADLLQNYQEEEKNFDTYGFAIVIKNLSDDTYKSSIANETCIKDKESIDKPIAVQISQPIFYPIDKNINYSICNPIDYSIIYDILTQYSYAHRSIYYTHNPIEIYPIENHKYMLPGITKENIYNQLISNDYHSKLCAEKLLLKMLMTCNRISGFFKNLDKENKSKKKKSGKKYTEEQKRNYQSKKCDNNKRMLDHKFSLGDIGIEYLELELCYTQAHRVFGRGNKRFKYNGRFYGSVYQSIPKDLRKYIKINGEPVVEPDFSAMHIRLLYHQNSSDYQDDPYEACGGESLRKTFKMAFLIVINAKSEKAAMKSLSNKMHEKNLPWPDQKNPIRYIMDTIKKVHEPIAHQFSTDRGIELMRSDSEIMNNILMKLMEEGIPGLGVHDSVIVPQRHEQRLRQVMMEEYKKIMGFDPVIG